MSDKLTDEITSAFMAKSMPTPKKPVESVEVARMREAMGRAYVLSSSALGVLLGTLAKHDPKSKPTEQDIEQITKQRVIVDDHLGRIMNLWLAMNRHLQHFGIENDDGMVDKFNTIIAEFKAKTRNDLVQHVMDKKDESEDKDWFEGIVEWFDRAWSMVNMKKDETDGR